MAPLETFFHSPSGLRYRIVHQASSEYFEGMGKSTMDFNQTFLCCYDLAKIRQKLLFFNCLE